MTEAIQVQGLTKVFITGKDHPPLRSVLAFMMLVIGLSLPEMVIPRRVLKPQLIAIFIGTVAIAIIIIGYLFNWVL